VRVADAVGEAAAEADLRMVLDVEEVGAAQVGVAIGLPRPQLGRVDHALEVGLHAVIQVEVDPAVHVLERTPDPGDHHVSGGELRRRVPRLERPTSHLLPIRFDDSSTTKLEKASSRVAPRACRRACLVVLLLGADLVRGDAIGMGLARRVGLPPRVLTGGIAVVIGVLGLTRERTAQPSQGLFHLIKHPRSL